MISLQPSILCCLTCWFSLNGKSDWDFSRKRIKIARKGVRDVLECVGKGLYFSLPFSVICISSRVKIEHSFWKGLNSFVCSETKLLLVRAVKSSLTLASLLWTFETETVLIHGPGCRAQLCPDCTLEQESLFNISPSAFPEAPLLPTGDPWCPPGSTLQSKLQAVSHCTVLHMRRRWKCLYLMQGGPVVLSSYSYKMFVHNCLSKKEQVSPF